MDRMSSGRREHSPVPSLDAMKALAAFIAALFACVPARAQQTTPPDATKARVLLGPVALNPVVELTNLGVDTNVFNEPSDEAKKDFTFTLTPRTDVVTKIGRTWLTASLRDDVVWYQTYSSERSNNARISFGLIVPLNRFAFGVDGNYLHARERPGFEIDARAKRSEWMGRAAAEYRALAKTFIVVRGSRQKVDFDQTETFLGSNLQAELDRTATSASVGVKYQVTPLTAFAVDYARDEDRFDFSSLRDSTSNRISVGVAFDPFALIKGSARFGYRDFEPADPALPGFKGTTAAVDLSYVLQGSTRLAFQFGRDIQYSYDVNQPYYLQTGFTGSIAQQIYGPVDAVFRAGTQHLAYRDRSGGVVAIPNREDDVASWGAGVGYHIGNDLRIGVNIDKSRRTSDLERRRYDGLRFGTSVTYGL